MRRIRAHVRPVDATERVAVIDALALLQRSSGVVNCPRWLERGVGA